MDVEDVVRWACARPAARNSGDPKTRLRGGMNLPREDASLVGRWTFPAGFPSISPMFAGGYASGGSGRPRGPIDPDAEIVETAIGEIGAAFPASLGENPAIAALALDIGLPVDVEGALASAAGSAANLLLAHGRLANRPAFGVWRPTSRAKLGANGKPAAFRIERWGEPTISGGRVERDVERPVARLRHDLYPSGSYGVLLWEPDPQAIVNGRADYLVWRLALDALADALSGRLAAISALAPAASLTPWLGERDGDKPRDLFGPGAAGVYTALEAEAIAARRTSRQRRRLTAAGAPKRRPARPGPGAASGGRA